MIFAHLVFLPWYVLFENPIVCFQAFPIRLPVIHISLILRFIPMLLALERLLSLWRTASVMFRRHLSPVRYARPPSGQYAGPSVAPSILNLPGAFPLFKISFRKSLLLHRPLWNTFHLLLAGGRCEVIGPCSSYENAPFSNRRGMYLNDFLNTPPHAEPKTWYGVAWTMTSLVRWVNQSGISNVAVIRVMSKVGRYITRPAGASAV